VWRHDWQSGGKIIRWDSSANMRGAPRSHRVSRGSWGAICSWLGWCDKRPAHKVLVALHLQTALLLNKVHIPLVESSHHVWLPVLPPRTQILFYLAPTIYHLFFTVLAVHIILLYIFHVLKTMSDSPADCQLSTVFFHAFACLDFPLIAWYN